jgi:hypothetical protein
VPLARCGRQWKVLQTPKPSSYGHQSASLAKTSGSPESGEESLGVLIAKVKAMLDGGTPSTFYNAWPEPASKSGGSESRLLPSPLVEGKLKTWVGVNFVEHKQWPIKTMVLCKIAEPDPDPDAKIVYVTDGLGNGVATTLKCANEFYFPKKWVLSAEHHSDGPITLLSMHGAKVEFGITEANRALHSGWKLARV